MYARTGLCMHAWLYGERQQNYWRNCAFAFQKSAAYLEDIYGLSFLFKPFRLKEKLFTASAYCSWWHLRKSNLPLGFAWAQHLGLKLQIFGLALQLVHSMMHFSGNVNHCTMIEMAWIMHRPSLQLQDDERNKDNQMILCASNLASCNCIEIRLVFEWKVDNWNRSIYHVYFAIAKFNFAKYLTFFMLISCFSQV